MDWAIAFPIAVTHWDVVSAWLLRVLAIALAFGVIVFVHEAGHFLTARLSGMAVHEFSLGFGRPLLFWFKRGETQYSIRLWPFISYVRIAGMEPDDEHPRGFDKKPRWQRAVVLIAGCVMNLALAVVIYIALGLHFGSAIPTNEIRSVEAKTPAAQVGLQRGDRLIGVNGRTGLSLADIRSVIMTHPQKPMQLIIDRKGQRLDIPITPGVRNDIEIHGWHIVRVQRGQIGISFDSRIVPIGVGEAIASGFSSMWLMFKAQIIGIIAVIGKQLPANEALRGPVGIVDMMYTEAQRGWADFLFLVAALTVAVGFINLLPFPPLDGSRLVILGLEGIIGHSFDKRKELVIHLVGMVVLLSLVLILTLRDIQRIVNPGGG